MTEKIIIIHPSEIIRKGLFSIIQLLCSRDIVVLNSFSEIHPYIEQNDLKLVVFADVHLFASQQMTALINTKKVKVVKINGNTESGIGMNKSDYSISLQSTSADIGCILNEILGVKEKDLEGHEGEELTVREKEVLKLVAAGFPNKLIADKLFISVHTVISHRKNITEKLGIKSISGLTVYAIINHLITPSEIDSNLLA